MPNEPGRAKYPHVFTPLAIGPIEVPNRFFMGPHGIPLEAPTPGVEAYRSPSVEAAHYYAERAAAGVGLLFHSQKVAPVAGFHWYTANPWFTESIPSYARVAEGVHEHGAKLFAQLHYTAHTLQNWEPLGPTVPPLRPSPEPHFIVQAVGLEMRKKEIRWMAEAYAQATRNLREAGYDGVEVHASHGALYEKFLSPYFNHRSDEYGGSLENRARFLLETLELMRSQTDGRMALGIRMTADQLLPGGMDEEDAAEFLQLMAKSGLVDFADIDIAVEPEQQELMATSAFLGRHHNVDRVARLSQFARPLVTIAVPGQVTSLGEAEDMLARGVADMIGAVRGLIAEPELVKNSLEGREDRNRRCLTVNQCIESALFQGFGCAINPASGREDRWGVRKIAPAPRQTKVVVVGAGPGGLEAARVARLRGHEVVLLERASRLGGAVNLWAQLPGRGHMASAPTWWTDRLQELGVTIRTGVDADAGTVIGEAPEVVIVATGSHYSLAGETGFRPSAIPGYDQSFVCSPEAVLADGLKLAGRVIVLDEEGLSTAVGIAELAAAGGAEVQLLTRKAMQAAHLNAAERPLVLKRLRDAGVSSVGGVQVTQIGDHSVTLADLEGGQERSIEDVDWLVMSATRLPNNALHAAIEDQVPYAYLIGDALSPRRLSNATYEGHRFARVIGEHDMPGSVTEEIFKPMTPMRPAA